MDLREQLQSTLGTSYTLERELGGGGMSRVFVANENALGRKVVVKVLPPEMTQGVSVERFKREIQLAAQLQHPHIVPVHASGETGGLPFYTMPFVDGASLRSRLAKVGALPIGETISILREVAKALAYAHERGVVHRDIKPDNVLITGGSAVVTDFGIAKALSASRLQAPDGTLTQLGTSIGTPAYMAPEQAAGDPNVDHRADLYSFGCLAYELLAGNPPFHGRTPQRMLAAHMGERPQAISELRPDTPPLLGELVMRCLAKEPDDRPQTAADLVRVLESVATSGGASDTIAMPNAGYVITSYAVSADTHELALFETDCAPSPARPQGLLVSSVRGTATSHTIAFQSFPPMVVGDPSWEPDGRHVDAVDRTGNSAGITRWDAFAAKSINDGSDACGDLTGAGLATAVDVDATGSAWVALQTGTSMDVVRCTGGTPTKMFTVAGNDSPQDLAVTANGRAVLLTDSAGKVWRWASGSTGPTMLSPTVPQPQVSW